jgi:hypothetical protein
MSVLSVFKIAGKIMPDIHAQEFNGQAGGQPVTQSEARRLFAEARKFAYPTRTLGSFKLLYITDPDQPGAMEALEKMYGLYEKVFPLAEERESFDSLIDVLRANNGKYGQGDDAPAREQWVLIENDKGEIVAANCSMVFSAAKEPEVAQYIAGTMHMSYTFVDPAYRGQSHGERASGYSCEKAREFIAGTFNDGRKATSVPIIEFAEQNAILKMTPAKVLVDTAGARTDQSKRRQIFETWGFRQLDLPSPYVQLPLVPRAEGGESSASMDLICRGVPAPNAFMNVAAAPEAIPSPVIKFHLRQFMKQAVAKNNYDISADPDWIRQADALDAGEVVPVMPELDHLALKDRVWTQMEGIVNAPDFDSSTFTGRTVGDITGIKSVPVKTAGKQATPASQPQIHYVVS